MFRKNKFKKKKIKNEKKEYQKAFVGLNPCSIPYESSNHGPRPKPKPNFRSSPKYGPNAIFEAQDLLLPIILNVPIVIGYSSIDPPRSDPNPNPGPTKFTNPEPKLEEQVTRIRSYGIFRSSPFSAPKHLNVHVWFVSFLKFNHVN